MIPADELIRTVKSDLRYLRGEWNQDVDDDTLRRSSTVLRRLLVDNELQRAWKMSGAPKQPIVKALDINDAIGDVPLEKIELAAAGGAHYKGARMAGIVMGPFVLTEEQAKQRGSRREPVFTPMALNVFMAAPAIVAKSLLIPRHHVIKYVANKLGGAHYDADRASDTQEGLSHSRLDRIDALLLDKPVVYFEILSAGQALVESDDIKRFMA
jgi:hypothetical protein